MTTASSTRSISAQGWEKEKPKPRIKESHPQITRVRHLVRWSPGIRRMKKIWAAPSIEESAGGVLQNYLAFFLYFLDGERICRKAASTAWLWASECHSIQGYWTRWNVWEISPQLGGGPIYFFDFSLGGMKAIRPIKITKRNDNFGSNTCNKVKEIIAWKSAWYVFV